MGKHTSSPKARHNSGVMGRGVGGTYGKGASRTMRTKGSEPQHVGVRHGHAGGVGDGEVESARYVHGSRAPTRAAQQIRWRSRSGSTVGIGGR